MKKLFFLLLILLIAGCSPQKRISRLLQRYPLESSTDSVTIIKDSIHVEYRDRIVHDTILGDTVYTDKVVSKVVKTGLFRSDTAILENDYSVAKAWVQNAKLYSFLIQKDQVIDRILKDAERKETYWREQYNSVSTVTIPPPVKYIPPLVKYAAWGFLILLILIGIIIYLKLKTSVLKKVF